MPNLKATANFFEEITKRVVDLSTNAENRLPSDELDEEKLLVADAGDQANERKSENATKKPAVLNRRVSKELNGHASIGRGSGGSRLKTLVGNFFWQSIVSSSNLIRFYLI